jgi:putative hemolysin
MLAIASELGVIFLLMFLNGLFAMSEIAILSARKLRLEQLSTRGNKGAKTALNLANNPNQILSTTQIGITLIGIFAGAYSGANLSTRLAVPLHQIPVLSPYSDAIALSLVVISLSYLSLVIGELVPKRFALTDPEVIASRVAAPLQSLAKVMAPIVHVLSFSTNLILRLLGIKTTDTNPTVTEEEIKILFKQGKEAGMFEEAEHSMVEEVLKLGDRKVRTLMTPRPEILWLDLEDPTEINRDKIIRSNHTRFPVCQGSLDEVLGIIQVTHLLADCLTGKDFELTSQLRPPLFIPESTRGLKVLEFFQQTDSHIALVVDEYGVIQGLVTITDILEAIVGDVPSSSPDDIPQILEREDGSWLIDGIVSIDELKELLAIAELPHESQGNFHTVGGFIVTYLGKIPIATDHFNWRNLRFEVMDMDGNRVDKILVTIIAAEIAEA